jgi:hypothetical protein
MISDLISTIILIVGAPALFLIMFLPALFELRRPRDKGPRRIMENCPGTSFVSPPVVAVRNIEEDCMFDQTLLSRLGSVIAVLPCLEA